MGLSRDTGTPLFVGLSLSAWKLAFWQDTPFWTKLDKPNKSKIHWIHLPPSKPVKTPQPCTGNCKEWCRACTGSNNGATHQLSSVEKASPLKLTARGWTYQSVGCPPHPSTKWFWDAYKMVAGYCLQNGDSSVTHLPINMRNMLAYFWVNIVPKKSRKMGEPVCKTQYPCVSTLALWERPNCRQSTLSETSC